MAGHDVKNDDRERTADVEFYPNLEFSKMFLSEPLVRGLSRNNFYCPSPIQARAIPLGKMGLDLLVQAKSGTGKTLVFAVLMLEKHNPDVGFPQSLVLVPTREIATQIEEVLNKVGYSLPNFRAQSFIGGMDVNQDRKNLQGCSAVVGTPGRIVHLLKNGLLNPRHISFLVLDEADSLIVGSMQQDVDQIIRHLSYKRQTVVCSATFYNNCDRRLLKYLNDSYIGVTPKKEVPVLHGIRQFIREIPESRDNIKELMAKINVMNEIFKKLPFSQCLIFANTQTKVETYCSYLNRAGWPTEVIRGGQDQRLRLKTVKNLKKFKVRILAATDVIARGIDAANVNLVINIDSPRDNSTYLHRIGRAGRFGTKAIAITLASSGKDIDRFRNILFDIGGNEMSIYRLPDVAIEDVWNFDQYGDKYDKFYASRLEQEISDSGIDRLEPILEVDSKTELDCKSSETVNSSKSSLKQSSATSMEEDSLEKIARLRRAQTETPMEEDSLEKLVKKEAPPRALDSDEEEALEELVRIIPLGEKDPIPEEEGDGAEKEADSTTDSEFNREMEEAKKHPMQLAEDDIRRMYNSVGGGGAPSKVNDQLDESVQRLNQEEELPKYEEVSSSVGPTVDQMFLDAMKRAGLDDSMETEDADDDKENSKVSIESGESAPITELDRMFLAAMEVLDMEESQENVEEKPVAQPKASEDVVNKMFLAAMKLLDDEEEQSQVENKAPEDPVDQMFRAAMETVDKEEQQSQVVETSAAQLLASAEDPVDKLILAAMVKIDSEESDLEPELDSVDKLILTAMDTLNCDDEEAEPAVNGITPEAMDKFDHDEEEYNVPQAVANSSPELSCSTPESCYTTDSSFSSNATKKVEVGSNFTTPNTRVQEIRMAAPTRQISSSTSDNSSLSQMSDPGVPAEPNCLPLEVNNDALFAKIMEQKELEAEHQQQRPFQFSIDGCSLEVHDDPVSDRDINSRKGSVPDVVPSGITLDPSRLQNRSPTPSAAQEAAAFDLNSNTCGSNHGSVFEAEEEAVIPQQDQRTKRIRFQQDGIAGGSDSLELKSDSGDQPGENPAAEQDPLALPPMQNAVPEEVEDASSYSSEYDSQSSNSSFFDQRDLWESEAAQPEVDNGREQREQQQRRRSKVSKRAKETTNAYHRTYASWTTQYWNQMTMIRDYARFALYARQGGY